MIIEYEFYNYLHKEIREIREVVFVREQGFTDEFDDVDLEDISIHLLVRIDGKAAATGRLFPKANRDKEYVIGRVAVLEDFRKLGLGRLVMESLEMKALDIGASTLELSAQCRARGFYERLAYKAKGDVYLDGDCPHILMTRKLTRP